MKGLVGRFADQHAIESQDDLNQLGIAPTPKQRAAIMKRVSRGSKPISFRQAWIENFVSNKFGAATTHWAKLADRVARGVGNPCPLVLIGLPASIVKFGEDPDTVAALLDEAAEDEEFG